MIDDKYKDICYIDGFEVVPKWKQCGEYDPNWSEDQKYLWNSGCCDHHMELVSLNDPEKDKKYFEKCWYVWKDHWCGYIVIHDDGAFTAEMKEVMIGWSSPKYNSIEGAIYYIMMNHYGKKSHSYRVDKEED